MFLVDEERGLVIISQYTFFSHFSLSEFFVVSWSNQELFSVILLLDHISMCSTVDICRGLFQVSC